ncbi:MAG: hypothetical protein N2V72_03735 [Methanophagales archaeon]|nr:hypothetical protein [Methanophagales archaeon]
MMKRPVVGVPEVKAGRRGPKPARSRVLSPDKPLKVFDIAPGKRRTASTEVFSVDAPSGTDLSRLMVHHTDKNRVGGAVRSRPKPVAAVRGGRVTSAVHTECTSSAACSHAAATVNA